MWRMANNLQFSSTHIAHSHSTPFPETHSNQLRQRRTDAKWKCFSLFFLSFLRTSNNNDMILNKVFFYQLPSPLCCGCFQYKYEYRDGAIAILWLERVLERCTNVPISALNDTARRRDTSLCYCMRFADDMRASSFKLIAKQRTIWIHPLSVRRRRRRCGSSYVVAIRFPMASPPPQIGFTCLSTNSKWIYPHEIVSMERQCVNNTC